MTLVILQFNDSERSSQQSEAAAGLLMSCLALGKSPHLCGSQFPHLQTEGIELEWFLRTLTAIKKKSSEYKEIGESNHVRAHLKIDSFSPSLGMFNFSEKF